MTQDRREEAIPREIEHPCFNCGNPAPVPNGAYYQRMRKLAKLTLAEMARLCRVSDTQLSRMERGEDVFLPKYVALYVRLLERRHRSGQDW